MITEDHVSFEVAKLLKEKEFNEPCNAYWFHMIDAEPIFNGDMPRQVYNNKSDTIEIICCPTLQMAMKWLREVHAIDIFPWKIGKGIYSCAIFNSNTGQDLSSDKDFPSEKYEETVDAALKYCLKNLI